MMISILKSKLHNALVTDANLDYEGSITIDENWMDEVGIVAYEKVLVANKSNGARFETYVIKGTHGSGTICINGAAAHLAKTGDRVIILAFGQVQASEAHNYSPRVLTFG